jgi:hypothetical protein
MNHIDEFTFNTVDGFTLWVLALDVHASDHTELRLREVHLLKHRPLPLSHLPEDPSVISKHPIFRPHGPIDIEFINDAAAHP